MFCENTEEYYGGSIVYIYSSDVDTVIEESKPLINNSILTMDRASMEFSYIFNLK